MDNEITIRPDIVASWKPEQRVAAWCLAIGMTWQATADRVGVKSLQTLANWLKKPEFADYVDYLRATALSRVEPTIMTNLELALDLQRQVLSGELDADDARWREADKLIGRFLDRLLYVEPAGAGGNPTGGMAPQFNIYANGRDEAA